MSPHLKEMMILIQTCQYMFDVCTERFLCCECAFSLLGCQLAYTS